MRVVGHRKSNEMKFIHGLLTQPPQIIMRTVLQQELQQHGPFLSYESTEQDVEHLCPQNEMPADL